MPPTNLSDFERKELSYYEHERRFCLRREEGTLIKAYNIDIAGANKQYFKALYAVKKHQGRRSADGLYVGSFHEKGKQIYFIIVLELEGHASFEDAIGQVKGTLEHFCQNFKDANLDDDGHRHHIQAKQTPRPYISQGIHVVVGVVIGSAARQGTLTSYRNWPIVCLNSRQPVQDKTPLALLEEISAYTGKRFW